MGHSNAARRQATARRLPLRASMPLPNTFVYRNLMRANAIRLHTTPLSNLTDSRSRSTTRSCSSFPPEGGFTQHGEVGMRQHGGGDVPTRVIKPVEWALIALYAASGT